MDDLDLSVLGPGRGEVKMWILWRFCVVFQFQFKFYVTAVTTVTPLDIHFFHVPCQALSIWNSISPRVTSIVSATSGSMRCHATQDSHEHDGLHKRLAKICYDLSDLSFQWSFCSFNFHHFACVSCVSCVTFDSGQKFRRRLYYASAEQSFRLGTSWRLWRDGHLSYPLAVLALAGWK